MIHFFGFLCYASMAIHAESSTPSVGEIEKLVLDSRRSIQSGHVVFTSRSEKNGIHDPRFDRITTIWCDGKKLRNDSSFRFTDQPKDTPQHVEKKCRHCEKDNYWFFYTDDRAEGNEVGAVLQNMTAHPRPETLGLVHPQLVGVVLDELPNLAAERNHLESFIGRTDRKSASVRPAKWKDSDCLLLSYQLQNDGLFRAWISPERNHSVLRMEGEWKVNGKRYFDSLESELREFKPSHLWYPQLIVYERRINEQVVDKSTVKVEVMSLNEPIPNDVFTLAGMDLPNNKPVYVSDRPLREGGTGAKYTYWNGTELVPKTNLIRDVSPDSEVRRWFLIANAVILACLTIYLLKRWKRTSRIA